ncbi:unnamed protein product [Coffea canephora]|uniref:Uncharacterized protein n=1 Tax=Coffea canephora TaxID=49390 RepID=A0A068TPJ5_COFCA|nr:unnamed protein product [Coffea canephora]
MFVKIVHPGGHVELQDRPIIAAEIMHRNPKFCVAYPNVFKQPWAVVAPETTLMPGHEFYVVPINTVRKLQLLSMKYSASQVLQNQTTTTTPNGINEGEIHGKHSGCFLFISGKHPNKVPYSCLRKSDIGGIGTTLKERKGDNCFTFLITGMKMKASSKDKSKETGSPKSFGSSETDALAIRRTIDHASSPKRLSSFDRWQPSLESITEEF